MKKILLFIIFLTPGVLFAQFAGRQPLRMPIKYDKPDLLSIADLEPSTERTNSNWTVWIDRKGVKTSNGKSPQFMQRFLVVEENDTKIHIVPADDSYDNSLGQFIKEPEDFGWVDKGFCVLSPSALYSKNKFRIKVMTITTPDLMMKELDRIKEGAKKLAFFDSPSDLTPNNNETQLFEIFYILKKDGTRYLLSKRDNISRGVASNYVNGWVDIESVQTWEQRQSLEPNWDREAANERQTSGIKASVFPTDEKSIQFGSSGDNSAAIWDDDKFSKRMDPYFKRFPIFSIKDNLIQTAVVSDLIQEDGTKVDDDKLVRIQRLYNEQRQKSRNINLVFVIDGTQSMGPYMNSVKSAVVESTVALQNSDNTFRFGAVVYRDYVRPDDKSCYPIQPLTTDKASFAKFLSIIDVNDPACIDQTTSEGLYLGLKLVEEVLRGREKETNIIIIIGDSGDREGEGRLKEDDIIPLVKRFGCAVLGMQVHHFVDPSYEDFITQIRDLGMKNASELVSIMNAEYSKENLSILNSRPRWKQSSAEHRTLYNLTSSPVSGAIQYTRKGEVIEPPVVKQEIKNIISSTNLKNDSILNQLANTITSVDTKIDTSKKSAFTLEGLQILLKAGFSPDMINIIKQQNYQFMLRGSTVLKTDRVRSDLFNFVLFLDQVELNDVKVSLDKIYTPGATSYGRRESLKNSWLEVLRANYGAKPDEVAGKTLSELMELITGLPSLNPLLKKYTADDLTDRIKVSDDEFDQITNLIRTKRDQLGKISGNREFMFLSNDRAYYWIPQSYLP